VSTYLGCPFALKQASKKKEEVISKDEKEKQKVVK
jgi:hypothetical protein